MNKDKTLAWISGVGSYAFWGLSPLYWHMLQHVSSLSVLAHRVIWSCIFLGVFWCYGVVCRKNKISTIPNVSRLFIASLILSINWGLYIWAIHNKVLLASSLGYFLAPIFYIMVGAIVFKERLSRFKVTATLMGALGVLPILYEVMFYGGIRELIVALGLAFSFTIYGYLKKGMQLSAMDGLLVESALISPFAIIYLAVQPSTTFIDIPTSLLLIGAGPITLLPLLCFAYSVNKLDFNNIGFLQYISPTFQFLIAVFVFDELVGVSKMLSFALVWLGILVLIYGERKGKRSANSV